jgi:dTDP-4-amino-4,6-dideoxygalactose transaminase
MVTSIGAEIPFVDLKAQYAAIREEVLAELADVLEGMQLFLGPRQRAFEADFAAYCEAADCISMSNGTDALELALRALGVGPGDEVLTQPNSFIATAEAISATGATPTFADVDERTATLDPAEVAKRLTPRTKAIIPVHLYGRPAEMAGLRAFAGEIPIIEDACQAHGARYQGRRAGSLGDLACFSFYFSKNLGAYGEGGAVTTSDPALAERVRMLRDHGSQVRYEHDVVGRNARMDELQAAILNVKLRYLDGWNAQRRANAAKLSAALADTSPTLPTAGGAEIEEVFHLYVVQHPERDRLRAFLGERGVQTGIHYPRPIHLQKAYADLGYEPGAFPIAERLSATVLSLPMYAELTDEQIERVASRVREFDRAGA